MPPPNVWKIYALRLILRHSATNQNLPTPSHLSDEPGALMKITVYGPQLTDLHFDTILNIFEQKNIHILLLFSYLMVLHL